MGKTEKKQNTFFFYIHTHTHSHPHTNPHTHSHIHTIALTHTQSNTLSSIGMRAYNFLFVVSLFLSFGLLIESKLAITHIGLTSKDKQSIKEAFLVNVNAYTGRWKTGAGATFDWLFFDNSKLIDFDC